MAVFDTTLGVGTILAGCISVGTSGIPYTTGVRAVTGGTGTGAAYDVDRPGGIIDDAHARNVFVAGKGSFCAARGLVAGTNGLT